MDADDDVPLPPSVDHRRGRTLPIWRGKEGSCRLDANCMIALMALLCYPDECLTEEGSASPQFQILASHVRAWKESSEAWEDWKEPDMTKARDVILSSLREGPTPMEISDLSSIWDTFGLIVPRSLCHFHLSTVWRCAARGCAARFSSTELEKRKTRDMTVLRFPAHMQRYSDMQALVERLVTSRLSFSSL
jgi:hypothetical protein